MKRKNIRYNEKTGEYENCSVSRGFPLGGMGSGCFNIGSDGRFTEFRINNNWMAPVKGVKGTFFAIYADNGQEKDGFFRSVPEKETLFTASLAGDWVSRYTGLGPVVDEKKARRHMALQYEVLIKNPIQKSAGKKSLPWAETRKDGTKITVKSLANLSPGELIYLW